ncbi:MULTISPECIES: hypothetical protein [Bacteroides]|uniref:CHAP domain-containing protein n=2 Tax=Bacteroidaceae TaxID=815 RepID=A0ABT7VG62_9BACE|nr:MULTISPECIES: hypothetical protein [Bacteroides]MBU3857357.1 hypothetical protein [Candidatus Phocaeicola excrementipullorum]MBW9200157.1 CHAP domain-containing protein [Bacteroidales bacterium SW299]MCR8919405.1 hypothetical protein [Bacteroides sp. ET225]MDM8209100.1 hypothetical protein [Bacteroides gallinaceum]MDM8325256.1 hypothetical protein [Bacteroides gallinaceum]
MKKITRKSLDELAKIMPIINETEQRTYIGGTMPPSGLYGSQTYTYQEYLAMMASGLWNGGYVEGLGVIGPDGGKISDGGYNVNETVSYLTSHAQSTSTQQCAKAIRQALEAGGLLTNGHPIDACDYDTWLQERGFYTVSSSITSGVYVPQAGDIVVFEAIEGHQHGHVAMYNGQYWISDFVQRDMYGGPAYRENPNTEYTILRR